MNASNLTPKPENEPLTHQMCNCTDCEREDGDTWICPQHGVMPRGE